MAVRFPITRKRVLLVLSLAVWVGGVSMGLLMLRWYSATPGMSADPLEHWPPESGIRRSPEKDSLLLFAHPYCPCTRASLHELSRILSAAARPVLALVLIVKPDGVGRGWEEGPNWELARSIDQATLVAIDEGGLEAKRFGALTSGQVVYYDRQGRLRFQGGITPARGHEGDNPGKDAVLALLALREPQTVRTSVYGCPLFDPGECIEKTFEK